MSPRTPGPRGGADRGRPRLLRRPGPARARRAAGQRRPAAARTVERHYNPICLALATMPKPVIAAVNGIAAGAGASLELRLRLPDRRRQREVPARVRQRGARAGHRRVVDAAAAGRPARATALAMLAEPVDAPGGAGDGPGQRGRAGRRAASGRVELAARLAAGPTAAYAAIKEPLALRRRAPAARLALEREGELQNALGSSALTAGRARPTARVHYARSAVKHGNFHRPVSAQLDADRGSPASSSARWSSTMPVACISA